MNLIMRSWPLYSGSGWLVGSQILERDSTLPRSSSLVRAPMSMTFFGSGRLTISLFLFMSIIDSPFGGSVACHMTRLSHQKHYQRWDPGWTSPFLGTGITMTTLGTCHSQSPALGFPSPCKSNIKFLAILIILFVICDLASTDDPSLIPPNFR